MLTIVFKHVVCSACFWCARLTTQPKPVRDHEGATTTVSATASRSGLAALLRESEDAASADTIRREHSASRADTLRGRGRDVGLHADREVSTGRSQRSGHGTRTAGVGSTGYGAPPDTMQATAWHHSTAALRADQAAEALDKEIASLTKQGLVASSC